MGKSTYFDLRTDKSGVSFEYVVSESVLPQVKPQHFNAI